MWKGQAERHRQHGLARRSEAQRQRFELLDEAVRWLGPDETHLDHEATLALLPAVRAGDPEAILRLLRGHARLAAQAALQASRSCLPLREPAELFNPALRGLLKAALAFREDSGCRFSTVAATYAWTEAIQATKNWRGLVRVPGGRTALRRRARERPGDATAAARRAAVVATLAGDQARRLHTERDERPDALAEAAELAALRDARLAAALAGLGERYRHVLVRRFGLDGAAPATLEVIGRELGVTKERIRQIEGKALARLRAREELAVLV